MKKPLAILALTIAAACQRTEAPRQNAAAAPPPAEMPAMQMTHGDSEITETAAADAPILTAGQLYMPAAREAYAKAAEIPDRLDKLYCYCHCHEHLKHRSLRTCFQTHHAEECNVCQKEAIIAWQDWKEGRTVNDSQIAADRAFNNGQPPPNT
ncbi:MAG: hypothetical protein JWO97_1332 [Acidobacteria bacterium]|nr:hypothetical protein [Acidobacteriota bacterium]